MDISTGTSRPAESAARGPADAPAGEGPTTVIDLTDARDAVGRVRLAARIREVREDLGAFLVVGHGISDQVVHGVREATATLFGEPERFAAELAVDPEDPLLRGPIAGSVEPLLAFDRLSLAYFHQLGPAAFVTPLAGPAGPATGSAYRRVRVDDYFAAKRRHARASERLITSSDRRRA
ncbi:isopenicillin N synthase-like dioxygenase [Kitasatospora sp. GP30]|uniref:2-oxoglutarate and iron-dependent oxygenase domain-containing protein n=1 Tax=Kitasatospora sp. GP30 TaxID=3035084 RepID=UPI000C7082E0|nr:2-oxoglutarate and iron-dependent oxygenase domain-containing protein [Kitasatospora sp. GP30]MDH6145161.1 isopenicillin N synthase-like dioxygenase [Kitasatospora sp. GP30]